MTKHFGVTMDVMLFRAISHKKHGWEGLLAARTSVDIAGQPVQPRRPACGLAFGVFDLDRPRGRGI